MSDEPQTGPETGPETGPQTGPEARPQTGPETGPADLPVIDWLSLPDVAGELGVDVSRVRNLIRDRQLLAVRRGAERTLHVPAAMIKDRQIVKGLPGTLTVLADAGFDDEAALRWLFREDDSLPGAPITALREDRGTEVRRRAQALAF